MNARVKGLEPIVAAVLLIVVAVIGAVLVYLWFAGYVTKSTSQAEQLAASEKLKIEAANLTTSGDVGLYVRNLGGAPVNITTIYVLTPGTLNPLCVKSQLKHEIDPGELKSIKESVCPSGRVASSRDYVIKIVTARGTEFAVTVTAS